MNFIPWKIVAKHDLVWMFFFVCLHWTRQFFMFINVQEYDNIWKLIILYLIDLWIIFSISLLQPSLPSNYSWLCLVWMETKSRTFSVKTAYQVALRLHRPMAGEHSLASHDMRCWNRVWALNTPSKVRNFIWHACSDVFPTQANLLWRKVHIIPLCTLCGQHDETAGHILWECPFARNTWALFRGKIQKSNFEALCLYLLAHQMLDRLLKKEMETWPMTAQSRGGAT